MYVHHFPEDTSPNGSYAYLMSDLIGQPTVHTGEWQAMDTTGSPAHATHELEDVSLVWDRIPSDPSSAFPYIDLAWAREHFAERVSGIPLNPAPSHERWPYAVGGNARHMTQKVFDHTYPERFWPQFPGHTGRNQGWNDPVTGVPVMSQPTSDGMYGIRFRYGDLGDVVDLLARNPLTRQAYLPVWFPEDTGAHHGQRVPCTLGYHFMQRGGRLSMRYYLRSCDAYRHLSNDVYFAMCLLRWMCAEIVLKTKDNAQPIRMRPGGMVIHISSLHAFAGDKKKIEDRILSLPRSM